MDIALYPGPSASQSLTGATRYTLNSSSTNMATLILSLLLVYQLKVSRSCIYVRFRRNKLDFIRILLLKRSIDRLALTETWLDETWNVVQLTVPGPYAVS